MRYFHAEGKLVKCDDGLKRTVIYRQTAKKMGLKRYFTGDTCKNGHIAERKTSKCQCTACIRLIQPRYHRGKMRMNEEYREQVRKRQRERHRERYASDKAYRKECIAQSKKYREKKKMEKEANGL